jgi:Tfp pilus assembly protein PilX
MLKAGVAKLEVTPPVGVRMAGFAGRALPSLAVHDPLWARALVLDDGARRAGLVALDLIYAPEDLVAKVREAVASPTGISPDGLLIASTHTHSGPQDAREEATDQERAYWASLPDKLIQVVSQAAASLQPARLGAASGWCAVGINRRERMPGNRIELGRNYFGVFDTELGVVRVEGLPAGRVEGATGAPIAALVNYTCHPVCLMADNYLISADYPGFARHLLEERLGGGMALFFNGACGNVNPREAAVNHGMVSGSNFSTAERAGANVAAEAARVWGKAIPADGVTLSFSRRTISLPTNYDRALKAAEQALAEAERQAGGPAPDESPYVTWRTRPNPERAKTRLARVRERGTAPVTCEIQVIRVGWPEGSPQGSIAFLGWPGEIFCELGMAAKEGSPFHPTYVIGYANGSIGYVPTPEAFGEGGYEVNVAAHLADNAGSVLVEESLALLNELAS